jgi:hypothetical protein
MPRGTVKAFTRRPACLGSRAIATAGSGNRFRARSNLNILILHENNGIDTSMPQRFSSGWKPEYFATTANLICE